MTGGDAGIYAFNSATGTIQITTHGSVTGTNPVTSTPGSGGSGIYALNVGNGATTITTYGAVSGQRAGVGTLTLGAGTTTITTNATVYGGLAGIGTRNAGTGATYITANAAVTGGVSGIGIANASTGTTTVVTNGSVTGNSGAGIQASTIGSMAITTNGAISGATDGIATSNSGGTTTITINGNVTGIAGRGIYAMALSPQAATTIAANGNSYAVPATTGSTGLSITTAAGTLVTGGIRGIYALNAGAGPTNILANGSVTGGTFGIETSNTGTASTTIIANGSVTGTTGSGIAVSNSGTGKTAITVGATGLVEGNVAAISVDPPGAITITNAGTIENLSGSSSALAISTAGAPTTISNGWVLRGTVSLGDLGNSLTNSGTWTTAGGTNSFGALTANNTISNQTTGTIVTALPTATAPTTTTFNGLGTFTNAGVITMQNGIAGDRTVITGNFVGQGGTIKLDTVLGNSSSVSDEVVLNGGSASGSTKLAIANAGGRGAITTGDGILVVDAINGATTTANAFQSGVLSVGAFEYVLYRGGVGADAGNQNFYLRSPNASPNTPSAQTILPYASVLNAFAAATVGTLQQREGDRVWVDPALDTGAWYRAGGQFDHLSPAGSGTNYQQGLGFMQGGYEKEAYTDERGALALGAFASIGTSVATLNLSPNPLNGTSRTGRINTAGYGLSGNAIWTGRDGYYVDTIAQFLYTSSTLTNKVGTNDGYNTAFSLEVGRRFDIGSTLALVPQAQLVYAHALFNGYTDQSGNYIHLINGDSLTGRIGTRLERTQRWTLNSGETAKLQTYVIGNLTYQYLGNLATNFAGTTITQQQDRLWAEFGLGSDYKWAQNWSVHAEASLAGAASGSSANDNLSKNFQMKGVVGVKYQW